MKRPGFTLVELLVVVAIVAILASLLLPAVQSAREAGRRSSCANNMRQLGVALHNFHDVNQTFPASGWTQVGPGNPSGKYVGWRPLLLPYLEQQNVNSLYDCSINWWEGTNLAVAAIPIGTFRCPSTANRQEVLSAIAKPPRPALTFANPIAPADYEALMGVQPASINPHLASPIYNATNRFSILYRNSTVRFANVLDGTSQTVAVVECSARPLVHRGRLPQPSLTNDQGIGWADSEGPFSLDGATTDGTVEGCGVPCASPMNRKNDNEPFSFHSGGANFLFVDGHVQFLSGSISMPVMAAFATAAANEITD